MSFLPPSRFACLFVVPLFLFLHLVPAASLRAENPVPQPEESGLLDPSGYKFFKLEGAEAQKARFIIKATDGPGCKSLLRLETMQACSSPYAAQITQHNREAIRKGDVLLAHFYLRTVKSSLESGEGFVQFVVEDSRSYSKNARFDASALSEWREFFVPFTATADYPPGGASVIFRAGFQPQTVEITGLAIRDFGASEDFWKLQGAARKLSYPGLASDAPWRAEADRRIAKIRKSDLTVRVVDASGHPVPGVELTVRQTRHAYWFGSAVRVDAIMDTGNPTEQAKYRAALPELFNEVTFENDLKWPFWMRNLDATQAAVKWLDTQGIALRGHNFVWPSHTKGLPESLYPLVDKPDELRQAITDHIKEVTSRIQPPAAAWDVLNETFNNHEFMDVLGRNAMVTWFQTARECSPQSRLFINDFGIVTGGGTDKPHQDDYEKTIAWLLENKAPLDGIGMQGHFGREPTAPGRLLAVLDRFGKLGKEIQMTEYSTQFDDPKEAAQYLRDCLTVFFSHPSTSGFILWGFHEGSGMKQKSFLYDKDWNLTPSGEVWKSLVYGKWWTNATATTGPDGTAKINGFHGQYEITARDHDVETKTTIELKPGGATARIVEGNTPAPVSASN
ncbi:MAG: endo-1,4-beta-xylanase [Chthoniobacteraceae bacterium]